MDILYNRQKKIEEKLGDIFKADFEKNLISYDFHKISEKGEIKEIFV